MNLKVRVFLFGVLVSLSLLGVWWAPLIFGIAMLVSGELYEVLIIGIILDLSFVGVATYNVGGFYFAIFLFVLVVAGFVRRRLLIS